MTEVKAKLKNYRQSPRKVRLVADLIRGKRVERALNELKYVNKKSAQVLSKLLSSAVANAKHNNKLKEENLFLNKITVDEGATMKRFKAGARGRAFPFKRRTSHITITVTEKEDEAKEEIIKKTKVKKESVKK